MTDTKHLLNDGTHVSFIREQDFSLDIDHQRLFFEPENKTFAWKIINMTMENEAICIDMYRVISQEGCIPIPDPNDDFCDTCERSAIDEWPSYFKENVTIGTDDLLDNGTPVQFNIVPDDDECSDVTLIEKFQLNKDGRFMHARIIMRNL